MRLPLVKAAPLIMIGAALLFVIACETKPRVAGEVLAMVGNRVITTEDLMRRAEYTLRPDYCVGDNYIHKKIVLNSLIAEKLIALETPESQMFQNQEFMAYIQGRQEQTMRQWLAKVEGRDQVVVDTSALRQELKKAIRSYEVQFLNLPDSQAVEGWQRARNDGYGFEEIAQALTGSDTIPSHELSWFERGDPAIHAAVFSAQHRQGDILAPLELENGQFLIVKIKGWTDRPIITGDAYQQHQKDVTQQVLEREGDAIYRQFVANIMAGKELNLNPEVFNAYASRAANIYLRTPEEKQQLLNRAIWNVEEQVLTEPIGAGEKLPDDAILFEVDGESWNVGRFEATLKRHPLVFRKRTMSTAEFPEQLKYAIADLIRDENLTQEAYSRQYHEIPNVRQQTEMWQDHYISRQARNDFVQVQMAAQADTVDRTETQVIKRYMDPWIDSLQTKYSDQVQINTDLFEAIELSTVPMMVSMRNMPFPLAVPAFPRLTTDDRLDYGEKMENMQ